MANLFDIKKLAFSLNPADHVIPRIPLFGIDTVLPAREEQPAGLFGVPMTFPLRIKPSGAAGEPWLLPMEPQITVGGGNILVRRSVAKQTTGRGTIKERWAADDYSISIEGLLTSTTGLYPAADVARLRAMLEVRDTIDVICPLFETLGIRRIVIDKFNFPFTKGEENQGYQIQAYSDDDWQLFIPLKK